MNRKFEIKREGKTVSCIAPYHPKFVKKMHKAGAVWDKEKKVWSSNLLTEEDFRKAMKSTYGRIDEPCEVATINLTAQREIEATWGPVVWGDRPLCMAKKRNSGARVCSDVALIDESEPVEDGYESGIDSGGSSKYWSTVVRAGTVFRLNDVSLAMIDKTKDDDRWEIEILETHLETEDEFEPEKKPVADEMPLRDVDPQSIADLVLQNFSGTVGDLKAKLKQGKEPPLKKEYDDDEYKGMVAL